jgi:hypothetical protein
VTQPEPFDLVCYVYPGWDPRIRAASSRRGWMDGTPDRFAYRCLPLNIANAHGWEILSPCGFEAEWNGGSAVEDVVVRPDAGTPEHLAPVALFGQGVLTFHVSGLLRTPTGFNLWVSGPPNSAKDAIAPLGGVIETDWSPFSFTMNWRFTRPNHVIRFEENEPFCFFFPLERGLVERVRPRVAPIDETIELKASFEQWSASRDAFQAHVATNPPEAPSARWQKFYYRGTDAEGAPGPADHQAKLRLAEFAGATLHERAEAPKVCPVAHAAPDAPVAEGPSRDKLEWMMATTGRLRALSPRRNIARKFGISADEFLDAHYAANWPVLLGGELANWPALTRWTPDYLRRLVGPREVQVQANRDRDRDFERNMPAHSIAMPFDQFIDRIASPGVGNDLYLTAYNSAANSEALAPLAQDLGFLEKLLSRDTPTPQGMPWIGGAGTFTPLHHDLTNNLLVQVRGRKRLLLVAPSETPRLYNDRHVYSRVRDLAEPGVVARFPRLDGLQVHQVVMNAGDVLFIPIGWWHQVASLDPSVTFTHTNFHWANDFHASYPG